MTKYWNSKANEVDNTIEELTSFVKTHAKRMLQIFCGGYYGIIKHVEKMLRICYRGRHGIIIRAERMVSVGCWGQYAMISLQSKGISRRPRRCSEGIASSLQAWTCIICKDKNTKKKLREEPTVHTLNCFKLYGDLYGLVTRSLSICIGAWLQQVNTPITLNLSGITGTFRIIVMLSEFNY